MNSEEEIRAEAEKIMELRKQRLTVAEISARVHMCDTNIYKLMKKAGMHEEFFRFSPKKILVQEEADIRAMFGSGVPYREIAEKFGVGYKTVQRWRRNLKLPPGRRGGPNNCKADHAKIAELYENGMTMADIARQTDISAYYVKQILKKTGVYTDGRKRK